MNHSFKAGIYNGSGYYHKVTKAVCLKNRQRTHIFNPFVAVVKYMYPNSIAITYINVEEQGAICTRVDMLDTADSIGWVPPSSHHPPAPGPTISVGKLPHLTTHPSGNCCLVSGRGSNQAILIKILPPNLNTIKNWWWQFLSAGKNCTTQNPRTAVSCIPPREKVYLRRVETKPAGLGLSDAWLLDLPILLWASSLPGWFLCISLGLMNH